MFSLVAYLISCSIGYLSIRLILDDSKTLHTNNDSCMHIILSLPIGLGISSLLLFYLTLMIGRPQKTALLFVHAIVFVVLLFVNKQKRVSANKNRKVFFLKDGVSYFFLSIILLFVFLKMVPFFVTHPYGFWDSISTWNLRPRFLLASDNWIRAFSPLVWASDYPPHLPFIILWGWLLGGSDHVIAPIALAVAYTFVIIGFLFLSLRRYYRKSASQLMTVFLVLTPSFLGVAIMQYADIVLSCYNLIGALCCFIALKERRLDYIVLGQIAVSIGMFTKKEGVLFFLLLNMFIFFHLVLQDKTLLKKMCFALIIPLCMVVTLVIFKNSIPASREMFFKEAISMALLLKKTKEFFGFVVPSIFQVRTWALSWYVFLTVFILFFKKFFEGIRGVLSLSVVSLFIAYYVVYVLRMESTLNHLRFAYERLIMHFFPIVCFIIASVIFNDSHTLEN